ncbi:MAG TPA: hypothetical protein VF230_06600 [Acidimicrobiales bacterium]
MSFRRLLPAFAALVALAAAAAPTVGASALPAQASSTGEEHAHTHGPDGLGLDPRGRAKTPGAFAVDDTLKASWSDGQHDEFGNSLASPDYADAPDLAGKPQLHAVYIHPADKPSRFGTYASMFQADARQASQFLLDTRQRSLRWDEAVRGSGRYLDITVVRSAYKAKQLATGSQFDLVSRDLSRVFPTSNPAYANKKFVVWLDADSRYCGQGSLYQDTRRQAGNYNERRTTGIVYRPYTSDALTGGWCRGRTLLHEIGHNLGALQQVAPNAFDGAHCDDDDNDVMCYTAQAASGAGVAVFDAGSNDYWDPEGGKLPWWAVNLNKFLCPSTGCANANVANY